MPTIELPSYAKNIPKQNPRARLHICGRNVHKFYDEVFIRIFQNDIDIDIKQHAFCKVQQKTSYRQMKTVLSNISPSILKKI